ncbi:serine hydrolase [Amycolatopsis azurea]|uniref:serine hydrolase n=1 Tax=Amycolatopsis azurea TaxID=36819 RepID=UPI0038228CAA
MTNTVTWDAARWQARLDELRAAHHVPGAVLAVLVGDEIHELASGVLHRGTGVEATTDSVFQLGSIAKVHTATLIMRWRNRQAGPRRTARRGPRSPTAASATRCSAGSPRC